MNITKSSRHSKIAGDFGEALVLYWLSKRNFECARVDHTGLDLIARNPSTDELMGISVKSRTRVPGTESTYVLLRLRDLQGLDTGCAAFGCRPFFAFVVDVNDILHVFITSKQHVLDLYPQTPAGSGWRMTDSWLARYAADPEVMSFELRTLTLRWWKGQKRRPKRSR